VDYFNKMSELVLYVWKKVNEAPEIQETKQFQTSKRTLYLKKKL